MDCSRNVRSGRVDYQKGMAMNTTRRSMFGSLLAVACTPFIRFANPPKEIESPCADLSEIEQANELLRADVCGLVQQLQTAQRIWLDEKARADLLQTKYEMVCGKIPTGFRRVHRAVREGINCDGLSTFTVYEEMD
jgi:hypothetical protein